MIAKLLRFFSNFYFLRHALIVVLEQGLFSNEKSDEYMCKLFLLRVTKAIKIVLVCSEMVK